MLDAQVTVFAERVTVKRACRAFAVNERSYRHRRQRDQGALPVRSREPKVRGPHPASLTPDEKDMIVATLCEDRFVDLFKPFQTDCAALSPDGDGENQQGVSLAFRPRTPKKSHWVCPVPKGPP